VQHQHASRLSGAKFRREQKKEHKAPPNYARPCHSGKGRHAENTRVQISKELPPGGRPFGWSNATLPRFGSARLLSRQTIYKQNQWETFLPEWPLDLVDLACGMVAAPQNGSQLAAARRSPAPCVTI
jgi:hypothetical protein